MVHMFCPTIWGYHMEYFTFETGGGLCAWVGHNSDNTKVKVIVINNNSNQTASTNKHSNPCNSNRGKKVLQESFEIARSLGFRV